MAGEFCKHFLRDRIINAFWVPQKTNENQLFPLGSCLGHVPKVYFHFHFSFKKNGNQTCCLYNWICSLANAQHYRLYFEKSSNMAKNEEKSWFNMPSTHFSTICVLNLPYIIYIIKKYPPQLYGIKNSDFFFFSISCNTCREKIYIRDNRNEQIMIKKLDFCHNV